MIVKTYDNGWGDQWPVKKFEQNIVNACLKSQIEDQSQVVVINSTWYNNDYHLHVKKELEKTKFTHLVLVAMLDPAIPQLSWFSEFDCEKIAIGYYGTGIDFWALAADKFFQVYDQNLLVDADMISRAFMSLNRKPHWHRKKFYRELEFYNLLDQGLVSLGGTRSVDTVKDLVLAPNSDSQTLNIANDIFSLGDTLNWQTCFLNIVTETAWSINQTNFVSEKIYKPILGYRPFLVYDQDGGRQWLTERKFETYHSDFGDISDLDLTKHENMAPFLKILVEQGPAYWQSKFIALGEKICYNRSRFDSYIQEQKAYLNAQ